jgi:hypothetical protein
VKFLKTKLTILATIATLAILSSLSIFASADTGSQWVTYGLTTNNGGNVTFSPIAHGTSFVFPNATGNWVNYMLDTYTASFFTTDGLSATISFTGTGTIMGNPDGCSGEPCTGTVRLFFQSNLPSDGSAFCVGGNANVNNYWWSDTAFYAFTTSSGGTTLTASFSDPWSNICGQPSSTNGGAGFMAALSNVKYVGLSFGSGSFFANGVDAQGAETFQLTGFTVS